MKSFIICLVFLIGSLEVFGWGSPKPQLPQNPPAQEQPSPSTPAPEVPAEVDPATVAAQVKIDARFVGFSPSQEKRMAGIVAAVEKVINSEEFKARVINSWYNGKAQFAWNEGLSNAQIYAKILAGNELVGAKGDNRVWDMEFKLESARCSTLGWTYPSVNTIWFNTCSFDERDDSGLGGTVCHEQLHKLGFDHPSRSKSWRQYTVPYAIGNICAEIYKGFLNGKTLTPIKPEGASQGNTTENRRRSDPGQGLRYGRGVPGLPSLGRAVAEAVL